MSQDDAAAEAPDPADTTRPKPSELRSSRPDCTQEEFGDYLATREQLHQLEIEASGRYDKWLMTLAGGSLALSVTFLDKIAKQPAPETLLYLGLSLVSIGGLSLARTPSALESRRPRPPPFPSSLAHIPTRKRPRQFGPVALTVFSCHLRFVTRRRSVNDPGK